MQCDICFRTGGNKLPFLCPIDARNQLYEPRVEHARMLLDKERIDKDIAEVISKRDVPSSQAGSRVLLEQQSASKELAQEKTRQIIAQADELRMKIDGARIEIAKKKAAIAARRSELASAENGLQSRRTRLLEEAEKKTKMTTYKWNQLHATTAQSRGYLGVEAARLYGLQRLRDANGGLSNDYNIAGVPILDLRAMCNKARPAEITASLTHVANLLVLTTHYLSLRLPAEITLPHRDYPLPTIFHTKDSYKSLNVPFPGYTPLHSSSNSPTASRHEESVRYPKPRPLYINKPLPALSKEDLLMFLEGAALLAYDVAWVCKTQGLPVGSSKGISTVDDVCELGPNLYRALIDSIPRPSPPSRMPSTASTPSKNTIPEDGRYPAPGSSMIGHFSHGTAHTFLGSALGNEFQRSFKLPSTTKISEQLKAHVLSEVAGTDWTLVSDDDTVFGDGEEDAEDGDGILVGGRRPVNRRDTERPQAQRESKSRRRSAVMARTKGLSDFGAASFMTMQTVADEGDEEKKQGTKGWTLLKDRS